MGKTYEQINDPEPAARYWADTKRAMDTRKPVVVMEKFESAGDSVTVQTVKNPIFDDDGTVIGVMGVFSEAPKDELPAD